MSVVGNIVYGANCTVKEVGRLIGCLSNKATDVCLSDKVNMWAKHKPVDSDKLSKLTDDDLKALNYGLVVPDYGYVLAISSANGSLIEDAISNVWDYVKPTGVCRMSDFDKYYHLAEPPIEAQFPNDGFSVNKDSKTYQTIYLNVDPDREGRSEFEIQGYELCEGELDLRDFHWVWVVKDPNGNYVSAGYSEEILDSDGDINIDAISINVSSFSTYRNAYEVFIGMGKFEDGRWKIISLPNGGPSSLNKMPIKIFITSDPISGGGGIEDPLNQVFFSYLMNGTFRSADDCTDEGSGAYALRNYTGDVYMKVTLKNNSSSSTTLRRDQIKAFVNERNITKNADSLFDASKNAVTSITIPGNGSVTCYMGFEGILSWYKNSIPQNIEIDIFRTNTGSNVNIWNGALYYCYGSDGWRTV